ncbi:MAG: zf-HC2 domain-containing protein [Syntrophomonas sp.]
MKCEQVKNLLSPYVDEMVDQKDKALIDAHIAACPKCRQQIEDYRHMANMMRRMEPPTLPDNFTAELSRRVRDEQNKLLGAYPLRTPKKSGWAAAVLAVFALTGGIYASSYWSFGNIVTAWQDTKENEKKPLISIDNIIERFQDWQDKDADKTDNMAGLTSDQNNQTTSTPAVGTGNPRKSTSSPVSSSKSADDATIKTTTLKVASVEQTLPQVLEIAANYGAAYTIIPPAANTPEDSYSLSKGVILEVEPDKAELLIKEVEALGSPMVNDDKASLLQAGDEADIESADQDKSQDQADQTQPATEPGESGQPKIMMKQETPSDQPGDDQKTAAKDEKITISIYLVEGTTEVKP